MITIDIEFTTKTVIGLSEAKVYKCEYDGYGEHIDDMVKWVRKAITNDNVRRPMITFSYWDDNRKCDVSTARIIGEYCDTYDLVTWDDRGNVTSKLEKVKPDARLIKRLYWDNVRRLEAIEEAVV